MVTKYKINEKIFETLTPESAYWIGFIYADGCIHVNKNGSKNLIIGLGIKDLNHLEKFKNFCETDSPIKLHNVTAGISEKRYAVCHLNLYRKKICQDLEKFGVYPRKSMNLKICDKIIDSKNILDFIRGYFDGDGCVSLYTNKHTKCLRINICGTLALLTQMKDVLLGYNIISSIYNISNIYQLNINRKQSIKTFKKVIYENATVFLNRKKEIFDLNVDLKIGLTSKHKNICFRPLKNRWRATYYENKKRMEKTFKTEALAKEFLDTLFQI